jgi:hypothetical protein
VQGGFQRSLASRAIPARAASTFWSAVGVRTRACATRARTRPLAFLVEAPTVLDYAVEYITDALQISGGVEKSAVRRPAGRRSW